MRAVLDPNVIASAVLSRGGTPAKLLRAWLDGGYELVVSAAVLAELERVLGYPKIARRVSADEARALVDVLRLQAELVGDPDDGPAVHSPDPDDDYLIALAQAATAVIVSGDTDLQCLAHQIPVHSPATFLVLLEDLGVVLADLLNETGGPITPDELSGAEKRLSHARRPRR